MKLKFLILVLTGSAPLAAQVTYSPYSYYGLGITRPRGAPVNRIFGGAGIGLFDGANLNTVNPAALNNVGGVSFLTNAGFTLEKGTLSNQKEKAAYTTGRLTSLDMWFRLSGKWSTAIGFTPISFLDYNVKTFGYFYDREEEVSKSGQGGFNQVYWSHAFQVIKNLNIGITGIYAQGTTDRAQLITTGPVTGSKFSYNTSSNGLGLDFGAQYSHALKEYFLTAGLVYSTKISLTKTKDATFTQQGSTLWDKSNIADNERLAIPQRLGGGLGVQKSRWNITADLTYTFWKKADVSYPYRDVWRLAAGGEFRLKQNMEIRRAPVSFRAGMYAGPNELTIGDFYDWGVSFGIGLPVAENRGVFHIGYQYNQTGTATQSLLAQSANTLILDFTFRDLWGIRRKNE